LTASADSKVYCCWSAWGDDTECGKYAGPGATCSNDPTVSCNSVTDCPVSSPPPPYSDPPPSPPPSPFPSGPKYGFWYGWVGSHSASPAPSTGMFFSFPGLTVRPPFTPSDYGTVPAPPSWGAYYLKILTQGGGDTGWGDSTYAELTTQLTEYKPAGWDGVCWDWEKTSADHTSAGFNALMKATKEAGLINILTSTAEGPYVWSSTNKDATDIDWTLIDYFVPQMYGAAGTLPAEWEDYARYWTSGAGVPNIHGVTFSPIPMEKFWWGMPAGTCDQALNQFGGTGCVEWAYSPGVRPPYASVS